MGRAVGHSEIATSIKFTNDGMRLLSASRDGCIFSWRLPPLWATEVKCRTIPN